MVLNNYCVYGLNIKSEIEIDEFEKISNIFNDDLVVIKYSKMDQEIKKSILEDRKIQLYQNKIWFHIDKMCIRDRPDILE